MPAASDWKDPPPEEPGRYLVEYEQHDQRRVFVADYDMYRRGGEIVWNWGNMDDVEVLRYAEINSEYA